MCFNPLILIFWFASGLMHQQQPSLSLWCLWVWNMWKYLKKNKIPKPCRIYSGVDWLQISFFFIPLVWNPLCFFNAICTSETTFLYFLKPLFHLTSIKKVVWASQMTQRTRVSHLPKGINHTSHIFVKNGVFLKQLLWQNIVRFQINIIQCVNILGPISIF